MLHCSILGRPALPVLQATERMATDFSKNEYWRKNYYKELSTRDANKDGFLAREDFDIIIQRYRDLGKTDEKRLAKLYETFEDMMESLGILDYGTKLTYEQVMEITGKNGAKYEDFVKCLTASFEVIDSDDNGVISYDEWENYYKALGIDTKYARASFDAMDTDGDGVISKDEFVAYNKEFYFSVDDNLKSSIMYGPLE